MKSWSRGSLRTSDRRGHVNVACILILLHQTLTFTVAILVLDNLIAKCTKFGFRLGLCPRPCLGNSLQGETQEPLY